MNKLMLVDGNSIMNRAFYGLKTVQMLSNKDGLYTNAIYGFLNILNKFMEEEKPDYIAVAFDLKAPTFRHLEYEGYKAQRKGMPEELSVQVPVLKEVLEAMNIKRVEKEGFEADDIIGTLSLTAENKGFEVIVLTGDRDSLQLVSEKITIKIPVTRAGKTETDLYNLQSFREKYGIEPSQFVDVKALMGDPSDNIPGVTGVGEKTALSLIQQFENLENLYKNINEISKKALKEKLIKGEDMAFLSRRLSAIDRNISELDQIESFKRVDINKAKVLELFRKLEFKSLISRYGLEEEIKEQSRRSLKIEYYVIKTQQEMADLHEKILNAKSFSFHVLFNGKSHDLTIGCLSINVNQINYYVNVDSFGQDNFLDLFKDIFENGQIMKISHDVKAFYVYLFNRNIQFRGLICDTMIGEYLLDPSSATYTVQDLAKKYLDLELEPIPVSKQKRQQDLIESDDEEFIRIVCTYSHVIGIFYKNILDLLEKYDQKELYYNIEQPLIEVLANMEYWGFKVDCDQLKDLSCQLEDKINSLTSEIYEAAGEVFNINSPKQLGVILFEKLNLPVIKKTKTGYSTDAEVLDELSSQNDVVRKILEYRQLVKLKSTYVEGLLSVINPNTGKIHSSFNQTVTVTGRISSTEPNLQNIPIKLEMGRNIRKVFVPSDENYILLDADYSQIELRVLAHITEDENMIQSFKSGVDIHATTASQIFNIPLSEVTPLMRSNAKAVNFGIVYGIGDYSLSRDLGITRKQARAYIDQYLNKYPNVKKYMHDIVEQGKENGFVTTMFNRRRYVPELKSKNFQVRSFGERVALNTPIQGSAADIIKIAMIKVYNRLRENKLKSRLILTVHDELIIETFINEIEEVKLILKESMENAADLKAPLNVDVKSGYSWYETK